MKRVVAMVLGVVIIGIGVWRMISGDTAPGALFTVIGAFLLFRGITNTVRPGL